MFLLRLTSGPMSRYLRTGRQGPAPLTQGDWTSAAVRADSPASCPAPLRPRCQPNALLRQVALELYRRERLPSFVRGVERSKATRNEETHPALRPMRGSLLTRSVWLRLGIGLDTHELRFRPPALLRIPKTKSVAPRQVRVPTRQNPPDSARAYAHYQVAEPRQMCWLSDIADLI
jgi:hypothetical protein